MHTFRGEGFFIIILRTYYDYKKIFFRKFYFLFFRTVDRLLKRMHARSIPATRSSLPIRFDFTDIAVFPAVIRLPRKASSSNIVLLYGNVTADPCSRKILSPDRSFPKSNTTLCGMIFILDKFYKKGDIFLENRLFDQK